MQDLSEKFERIFIHKDSLDSPLAARACALFPREMIEIVDERPLREVHGDLSAREFSQSKRLLYICKFAGQFFKRCPGVRPGLSCCNYFVLNLGLQCDMNCSYCYLQSFINSPVLTIYSNIEDALQELADLNLHDQVLRVGTGETIDSLSLDELTLYAQRLIAFFRDYPKWMLEFKTKSNKVDQFLKVEHIGNVIASWSINPQRVIEAEEHGTASLAERLEAAEKCKQQGFRISFHIDPMIYHPEWRESYGELVDEVCARFSPADIPVMSVGALRFQPEQKAMMRERFGFKSYVTCAETFLSADGKMRYDHNLRQEMYQFVLQRFRQNNAEWRIFMCMETPETWLKVEGQSPYKKEQLHSYFDPSVPRAVSQANSLL